MSSHISNERPAPDKVLTDIADYALSYKIESDLAYTTARYCLMDTLGCGLEALEYPACTKLLGPIVPGTVVPNGARVPGTELSTRSRAGGVQYRRHDSLARLQRHLARGRVGTSFRQSGRNSGHGRLALAHALARQPRSPCAPC